MDFYEKFLRVFAARGLTKRPSETPNEFNNRIFKAKILSAGDYNECEKIAKLFYMIKCSMKPTSAAMLEEADLAVMKIMGKIKTSAVIFKNK